MDDIPRDTKWTLDRDDADTTRWSREIPPEKLYKYTRYESDSPQTVEIILIDGKRWSVNVYMPDQNGDKQFMMKVSDEFDSREAAFQHVRSLFQLL